MNSFFSTPLRQPKKLLTLSLINLALLTAACEQKETQLVAPQSMTANSANLRLGTAEPQSTNQLTTSDLINVDPSQLRPYPSATHGVVPIFSYGHDDVPFPVKCYVDGNYVGTLKKAWNGKAGERFTYNSPNSDKLIWVALPLGQHTFSFQFPDGRCGFYRGEFAYAKPFKYTGGFDIWMMILTSCEYR